MQTVVPAEVESQLLSDLGIDGVSVPPPGRLLLGEMAFAGPLVKSLGPVSEVNHGHAVVVLVVENRHRALSIVHSLAPVPL